MSKAVLVTTDNKGVFFGYLKDNSAPDSVTLTDARCAVMWHRQVRGYLGLASSGPNANCRIGPAVPELILYGVTSVAECTNEATDAWEAAPWRKKDPA